MMHYHAEAEKQWSKQQLAEALQENNVALGRILHDPV